MRLILASASPARLRTLRNAGLDPQVCVSEVDEDEVVHRYGVVEPAEVALVLARAKAEDVAVRSEEALVLGCDSVLDLDGAVHGKPADVDQARARWQAMAGRSATLHTGHWLIDTRNDGSGATIGAVASTVVHFGQPTHDELEAYLTSGEPLWVAGAFTIDGLGGGFVRGVEGDHHNVVGVSLPLLRELLADLGIQWHQLWVATPNVR